MTTHDIDIELPAEFRSGNSVPVTVATIKRERMEEILRAAIEADRKRRFESGEALQRYKECEGDKESDPIERLRFYCSLAMSGQDWLDAEPFFDALVADRQRRGEPVAWIRKNGFRFISEIEPQDDSEVPLYATPQSAEPVKRKRRYAQGTALGEFGIIPMCDQVDDEPVEGAQ